MTRVYLIVLFTMKIYFSNSQVPELAGLTRQQRRLVFQCALEALFSDEPSTMWVGLPWLGGGIVSGALVGWMATAGDGLSRSRLFVIIACGLAGALAGAFIAGQLMTARLRPYYRRVLQERKDEIARITEKTAA